MATLGTILLMAGLLLTLGADATLHAQQDEQPAGDGEQTEERSEQQATGGESDDDDRDRRGGRRGPDGPPRGPGGMPHFEPLPIPLDDEQIDHILGLMEEMDDGSSRGLRELREENPDRFESVIARIGPHVLYMDHLRQNDPRAYELRRAEHELGMKAMHLAHRVRRADDEREEAEHREELRAVLAEQFDVRTRLLEHEMAQLERRLEHIREQIVDQKQRREHVVDRRMEMILSFDDRRGRGGPDRRDGDRRHDDDDDRRRGDRVPR